ncbi:HlyD family efflux transporter periplasmic adaptor subunit [Echinicola jeungdonensis]|uniref:HlyD family secretion protein n=1 Tax=Echinicola jeungdonensis TaxID=709343 RepID=A0ABV5J2Q7_9BACT|nr:HlyD family efflux transporter periplasmic adaptor subunit [Echinicola jeungdonensis]MDN3667941.1 HlyD family efflux transporter periplasmic adaptor subunit [Echinicola jeungdonensis]
MKTIFPASIVHQTTEYYQSKITVCSKIIYLSLLAGIILVIISLPFIKVDVSVQSRGTFQSALGRNNVYAPVSGRLVSFNLGENRSVKKGDVLAEIETNQVELEIEGLKTRSRTLSGFVKDLEKLILLTPSKVKDLKPIDFYSNYYQASFLEYYSEVKNYLSILKKEKRDFNRAEILYESEIIPFIEFDEVRVNYSKAQSNLDIFHKRKIASWENELLNYQEERRELVNQIRQLEERLHKYKILAGVDGDIMNLKNIKEGDFVFTNQKIAEISPDSALMAVVHVSPADIAFIKPGQKVLFQVDAYNYNQWGLVEGQVSEISKDLNMVSEREVAFTVICTVPEPKLNLESGIEGEIKRGMTLNSRFIIAKRSLFQLLYDKVDDWLNPTTQ